MDRRTNPYDRTRALRAGAVGTALTALLSAGLTGTASADLPTRAVPLDAVAGMQASAVDTLPWPLLRRGSDGQPVRSLQYLLRARGYALTVDGAFGGQTDRAVRSFQRSRGLVVDGIVGPRTWGRLLVTVQLGSRGQAVRAVQDQFQFRNGSGDPSVGVQVDGIFGRQTDGAVRAFQQAVGLTPDGIVGPMTWNQLIGGALAG